MHLAVNPPSAPTPSAAVAHRVDALNNSLGFADPASMFRYFSKTSFSPSLSRTHHMHDAGIKAAPDVRRWPRQSSVTEEEKRGTLMNDFMLIPSTDATAEEHARHAINMFSTTAVREPRRTSIGSGRE